MPGSGRRVWSQQRFEAEPIGDGFVCWYSAWYYKSMLLFASLDRKPLMKKLRKDLREE